MPPTEKKQKEMFKPYDTADVPDHMPFPEVAGVATTKNHETAVPKLNNHQRSWIHDVALRLVDFSNLKSKGAAREFYTQVKIDAFLSKAFQHVPRPEDLVEESRIPALVAAWKLAHLKKNGKKTVAAPDGDTSDNEEDEGGRTNLLRGYTMAGWRMASPPSLLFSSFRAALTNLKAIQKVISNKRSAEMAKLKSKNDNDLAEAEAATPQLLSKLLGLATYTGRDKFRGDRHDEILAHSKTLPGTSNAGSMFRKAEGVLWAAEPQDTWEAAANSNEGVDWVERQALVPLGFKTMVNQLNSSGKFMPFLAMMLMAWVDADGKVHIDWTEGAPPGIAVPHTFIKQHGHLVQHNIDAMYEWAARPLKGREANDQIDHVTGGVDSANAQPPFPLTVDDLDDIAPRVLTQKVTAFLIESYNGVFGTPEIPWAKIASNPMEYYDTHKFTFPFTSSGLADLSRPQWDVLATMLASGARGETPGFWRQPSIRTARSPAEDNIVLVDPKAVPNADAAAELKTDADAAAAKSKADADAAAAKTKADADAAAAKTKENAASAAKSKADADAAAAKLQADVNAAAAAAKTKEDSEVEVLDRDRAAAVEAESFRKRSKKRKADSELVPEMAGDTRRPLRTRRTPADAEVERKRKLAAPRGAKHSYEYVDRSPGKE
ncbi:hypothetical protein C8J57DRAFT_1234523 [Mycena rebaudengoi]|nr:hypothetical protein C8J57DRAFT_1234523 [Mycena rebaudengoi]